MILLKEIVCFLIRLILVLEVAFYILYHQIGPTCGFYALTYGATKIRLARNKKRIVREVIIDSIEKNRSYMGEIFDVKILLDIAKEKFPTAQIKLVDIKSSDDLDVYLKQNYIIFPCLEKDKSDFYTPHYYFLEKSLGKKYVYRGMVFIWRKTKKKEELYKIHEDLKEEKEFDWNKYFEYKDKKKANNFVSQIIWFSADYKLNRYLNQAEKRVRKDMLNQTTPIDMYGRVLLIKKK